jgi:hypothetical protein
VERAAADAGVAPGPQPRPHRRNSRAVCGAAARAASPHRRCAAAPRPGGAGCARFRRRREVGDMRRRPLDARSRASRCEHRGQLDTRLRQAGVPALAATTAAGVRVRLGAL